MNDVSRPLNGPREGPAGSPAPAAGDAEGEVRAVLRALPDILIRIDERGNVLDVQIGAAGATQNAGGEPPTKSEILARHVTSVFSTAAARAIAMRQMVVIEYPVEAGGIVQHYEARIVPVLGSQAVAFVRDITA